MKNKDLITELQKVDEDTEVYIESCCYPTTKWITVATVNGEVYLDGYRGSYVAGDPETRPT